MYRQKRNNNEIKLEFKDEGVNYTLRDDSIGKTEFILYENITNSSHERYESNKSYKTYAIYTAIIGVIFLLINIFYGTKMWAWLFLLASPIFFFLFRKSKTDFKVIDVNNYIDIYLIKDKQEDKIISDIYSKRNSYLKRVYGQINYENSQEEEVSRFSWLNSLGVINNREFQVIKEEILNK
jgi:hypothetical protein